MSKIKKLLLAIYTVIVIGLFTCGLVYAKANPDSLHFLGKNNTEVSLFINKQDLTQSNSVIDNKDSNLKIGQVIVSNGVKETVFAIGADSSYITIPASD